MCPSLCTASTLKAGGKTGELKVIASGDDKLFQVNDVGYQEQVEQK